MEPRSSDAWWRILTEKEGEDGRTRTTDADGDATETLIPISTQPISHLSRVTQSFIRWTNMTHPL